jgi:hypothetical protein
MFFLDLIYQVLLFVITGLLGAPIEAFSQALVP